MQGLSEGLQFVHGNDKLLRSNAKQPTYLGHKFINSIDEQRLIDLGFSHEWLLPNRAACLSLKSFLEKLDGIIRRHGSFSLKMKKVRPTSSTSSSGHKNMLLANLKRICAKNPHFNLNPTKMFGDECVLDYKCKANFSKPKKAPPHTTSMAAAAAAAAEKKRAAQIPFLCFRAKFLKFQGGSAMDGSTLRETVIGKKTWGVGVWIKGCWSLEMSALGLQKLNSTTNPPRLFPGTRVVQKHYFLGVLPWPVNLPLPHEISDPHADFANLYHRQTMARKMMDGKEASVFVPFVVIKGTPWSIDEREIQPEDIHMLRVWFGDDGKKVRDSIFTLSASLKNSFISKQVDLMRLTEIGSTPLEHVKGGSYNAFKALAAEARKEGEGEDGAPELVEEVLGEDGDEGEGEDADLDLDD